MTDECVCGDCRTCRRAMRLDTPAPTAVALSPLAAAILAEGPGYAPPPRNRVRPVQNRRRPERLSDRRRTDNAPNLTVRKSNPRPKHCAECGGLRAVATRGGGPYAHPFLTGDGDLCEVCADAIRYRAIVAAYEQAGSDKQGAMRTSAWRARRFLRRTLRDGRAYAPHASRHGSATAYCKDGCRCAPCLAWKADDNARRRGKAAA